MSSAFPIAALPFLFVLGLIFLVVSVPVLIVFMCLRAGRERRAADRLSAEDWAELDRLRAVAERLERRAENLEEILHVQGPSRTGQP